MKEKIIGVDLGATETKMGIVQDSEILNQMKFPTSAGASKQQIISELIKGIEQLADSDFLGIGIGVPGLIDEERGIIYDLLNIPAWKEVHLKDRLEEHFGKPVRITNDANVFAMGEKIYGDGGKFKNLVGITLGSGFGAGIIVDHRLYSGAFSSAGEIGSIPYLNKTIEDYCSGKFFSGQYNLTGTEVYELVRKGDEGAVKMFDEYGRHLGKAIKLIMYVLSPEAIFLGGSVSKSFRFFENSLLETLNDFPFGKVKDQMVILPSRTENISILGAAALITAEQAELKQPLI